MTQSSPPRLHVERERGRQPSETDVATLTGSTCCALWSTYVDGAIGSTAQVGSTPCWCRCWSRKATITSLGGRTPPGRETRTPFEESRRPASIRSAPVPVVSTGHAHRRQAGRCPASRSAGEPTGVTLPSCSPVSRRPLGSWPTVRMLVGVVKRPSGPRAHAAPGRTCWVVA